MSSAYTAGQRAETVAAEHLQRSAYKIVGRNWRTLYCEIDIIAGKDKAMYFMEVKYRQTHRQGSGFDYLTARKLRQMRFAAELWVLEHRWNNDYFIGAIEVSGPEFQITGFLPDCS
jgi:Holliday junction resolvase-like predicted endonuclease